MGVQICKAGFDLLTLPDLCYLKILHENEIILSQRVGGGGGGGWGVRLNLPLNVVLMQGFVKYRTVE